jgi:hypothetical protein
MINCREFCCCTVYCRVPEGESPVDVQQAHDEKDTPEDDHPSQGF